MSAPGATIRRLWNTLSPWPGGKACFSTIFGWIVPYTGSIAPRVESLGAGFATVSLRDHHFVRNHLDSIHAIALANMAEAASGLAMAYAMPASGRAILTGFSIEYVKKARGRLVAESRFTPPDFTIDGAHAIPVEVRDAAGDVVARAQATWQVGPVPALRASDVPLAR
jgi:acyl-coenzyme A thioesterase PaaI-like protein